MGKTMTGYQSKKTAALDEEGMYLVHETKRIDQIKDYAYPCIIAENAIKNVYNMINERNLDDALGECVTAIYELEDIIKYIQNEKIKTR
jgi:hypothetical protein